jgi:hypothetical protein
MVKSRLYSSALTRSPAGVRRLRRMNVAAAPPMKKKKVIEAK